MDRPRETQKERSRSQEFKSRILTWIIVAGGAFSLVAYMIYRSFPPSP